MSAAATPGAPGRLCQNGPMPAPAPAAASNRDVWVVIPLYNEATVIEGVVTDLVAEFPNVVCVDDGSNDGSAALARRAGARIVTHPINLGQGAALQTGFEFALAQAAQFVVTFDADGQHRIEDARHMLEYAREHDVAIVYGSRFLDNRTQAGFMKRLILRTAATVTNWATKTRLTDAHNGLRVIRADALKLIKLRQDRMAHGTEIIVQLGRTGLPYAERPVEVLYTDYSRAKGQSLLNSINILIDLIVR